MSESELKQMFPDATNRKEPIDYGPDDADMDKSLLALGIVICAVCLTGILLICLSTKYWNW